MDSSVPPARLAHSPRIVKVRGWFLVILGPALCLAMAYLAFYLAEAINGDLSGRHVSRWNGSHATAVQTFTLFGAVFLFGLVATAGGVSLLRRGRVGPVLMTLIILLVCFIIGLCYQDVTGIRPQ